MLRRDVLKGVFGGAAAVALGEMFRRETEAAPSPTPCDFFERSCSAEQGGICGKRCDWACGPSFKSYWTSYGCGVCLDRSCD